MKPKSLETHDAQPKPFDLRGYMDALGIVSQASDKEVRDTLDVADPNVHELLNQGFYNWINDGTDGHRATYASGNGGSFVIIEAIYDSVPRSTHISGSYVVAGNELSVSVDYEFQRKTPTVRVYINGELQAERADPFSYAQQMSQEFLRQVVTSRGEDPARLDKTIQPERDPYPFAVKMLHDLSTAKYDENKTTEAYERMSLKYTTEKVSDYLVSPDQQKETQAS